MHTTSTAASPNQWLTRKHDAAFLHGKHLNLRAIHLGKIFSEECRVRVRKRRVRPAGNRISSNALLPINNIFIANIATVSIQSPKLRMRRIEAGAALPPSQQTRCTRRETGSSERTHQTRCVLRVVQLSNMHTPLLSEHQPQSCAMSKVFTFNSMQRWF